MSDTSTRARSALVNGQHLHYQEFSSAGRPLVLLHGGVLTTESTFGRLLPQLTASSRVIGVELQGHGHTPDTDREFTLADLASDVVGLLDRLGIARADLFGFSVGGAVTLEIATSRPERVDRLVLASATYRADGFRTDLVPPTAEDFATMRSAHAAASPTPERFEEMMRKISQVARTSPDREEEQLAALEAPTLVIVGDDDFVRPEHALRMHQLLPDSRLAVLPGTAHLDVPDRAALIGPMVTDFLRR